MSEPARSDRNLLFGILALQMDFIDREALVAAMNAWVLDKVKPLGRILLEQHALSGEEHDLLQALVQKHIDKHGGDVQQSLAAVASVGSVREQLRKVPDADLQASLIHVAAARGDDADPFVTRADAADPFATLAPAADPFATLAPGAGVPTSSGLRFRRLRPHAKGGLGEVFVARDEELRREVALKEIQDRYADDPASRARFLLEAEITGGLEHPGIVPVYGLGSYADGRPYYAMRFIPGDSLQEAIVRFHKAEEGSRDQVERELALRQLLRRFIDVCNAIAYAHSRGVLHRDLKPDNVMLGPYGETLVVDWGLAKTLGSRTTEKNSTLPECPLQPQSPHSSTPTRTGTVIGTPAYMPPEQAAGRLDQLGTASDVYSLGATLYCLLTGKPPFEGADVGEVLRRVQRGDSPSPRTIKTEVPAALEAVCRKAMALRPEDRYVSPHTLAADVERWLADEPVSAWREPLRLRAGRWARRHQTLVAASTAAMLVLVLAAGAGAWWLDRERAEQRHNVESDLEDVADLQKQNRWQEAQAVLAQAKQRLGEGGPRDLKERLDREQAELDLVVRLDAIRLRRAIFVEGHFDTAGADRNFAQAFREAGMGEVGGDASAAAAWLTASGVRDALLAALDVWAACAHEEQRHAWLVEVARRAASDPWRDRVQDAKTWNDPHALARLAATGEAARQSPHLMCVVGMRVWKLKGDAEPLLRQTQRRHPRDFWANFNLANVLHAKGKAVESVGYHRAALALRPATAVVHLNLGYALNHAGQPDEAAIEYCKAIELDAKDAIAHNDLGVILRDKGQLDEAIAEFRIAIQLNPKYPKSYNNLGLTLYKQGHLQQALVECRKSIEVNAKYALAHANLGLVLHANGQCDDALAEYEKAIELEPKNAEYHYRLALALKIKGDVEKAIGHFQQSLELAPKNASTHYHLGLALAKQGRMEEAIGEYYKASALNPKDARIYLQLGYTLSHQGRRRESIAEYRKAIKLDSHCAFAHNNLGSDLRETGHVDEAIAECRKAIELDPKLTLAPYGLGLCLAARGEPDKAIDAYRKALELDADNANIYNALGKALADKDDLDAASKAFERGIALNPTRSSIHQSYAVVLKRRGDLEEAASQFHRALKLDPKNAWNQEQFARCQRMMALDKKSAAILKGSVRLATPFEQLDFAELCLLRRRPVAAVRFYAAAFTARPQLAEDSRAYRYDAIVAAARAAAGRREDAGKIGADERASYHRQAAIRWLHGDLAMRAKQIEHGTPQQKTFAQNRLRLWQRRKDFAVLRDAAALDKLPEAERADCRKLWDDVAALLKK